LLSSAGDIGMIRFRGLPPKFEGRVRKEGRRAGVYPGASIEFREVVEAAGDIGALGEVLFARIRRGGVGKGSRLGRQEGLGCGRVPRERSGRRRG